MSTLAILGLADEAVIRTATQLGPTIAVHIASEAPSAEQLSRLGVAGVSRLIHIWDAALPGALESNIEQALIHVSLLTSLVRQVEVTTLVVGDGNHAWLGPTLAEDLDLPHVTGVLDAVPAEPIKSPAAGKGDILVQRLCLQGVLRLRGPARCVLAVLPFGPLPQLALSAARPAKDTVRPAVPTVDFWNLDRLGLHPEDLPRSLLKLLQPARCTTFPLVRLTRSNSLPSDCAKTAWPRMRACKPMPKRMQCSLRTIL